MPNITDQLKQYGGMFAKGLIPTVAPGIAAGLMTDLFHQWNVDLARITSDIQNNRSLWAGLEDDHKRQLAFAAKRIGTIDFITVEWFIDAIKKDFPDIASLFLNWGMAGQWLQRQVEEIKTEINQVNKNPSPPQ